jgi:hypothetical protein
MNHVATLQAPLLPLGTEDNFHTTPTLLRGPNNAVVREDGLLQMLYCGNRNDSIYRATSVDGIAWVKNGSAVWKGYSPAVLRVNNELWLYSVAKPTTNNRPWEVVLARGSDWNHLKLTGTVLVSNTQQGALFRWSTFVQGCRRI